MVACLHLLVGSMLMLKMDDFLAREASTQRLRGRSGQGSLRDALDGSGSGAQLGYSCAVSGCRDGCHYGVRARLGSGSKAVSPVLNGGAVEVAVFGSGGNRPSCEHSRAQGNR